MSLDQASRYDEINRQWIDSGDRLSVLEGVLNHVSVGTDAHTEALIWRRFVVQWRAELVRERDRLLRG